MRDPRGRGAEPTGQLRHLAGCGNEGPRPGLAPIRRRAGSGDGARRPRERRGSARVKAGGLVVGWGCCSLAIDAGARTGRLAHQNEPLRRPRHAVELERQPRQRWARPLGDSNPCDSRSGHRLAPPATEVEIGCQGPRSFSDSARGVAAGRIVPFQGPRRRSGTGSPVRSSPAAPRLRRVVTGVTMVTLTGELD